MTVRYAPYTLTLRSPAVLTSLGSPANGSQTLPFIPGAALRGAAARKLGAPDLDDECMQVFRTVILDGGVRFLNAYPRAGQRRALPASVSLGVPKGAFVDPLVAWDLAAFTGEAETPETWPEEALSALPDPFITLGAARPIRVQPVLGSRIHQQRDRVHGRAWKEERDGLEETHGTVFSFEYLEAHQEFEGLVQVHGNNNKECDAWIDTVKGALSGPILLGRSRRSGYGGDATIAWGTTRERETEGQGLVNKDLPIDSIFRVLLTSPYVGRNLDSGQLDPAQLKTEVETAFADRAVVIRHRWRFELAGGFNRKWRLELPQALTCAAGSVLVIKTVAPITYSELLAVEHAGLGERRTEGFGRLLLLQGPTQRLTLHAPSSAAQVVPKAEPSEFVQFVEARLLDMAIAQAIDEEAARAVKNSTRPFPTPSLLGRLRSVMRGEPQDALSKLQTWLAQEEPHALRRPAMEQLERCRIAEGKRLSVWLREIADAQNIQQLRHSLRFDALAQRSHVISEATAIKHLTMRAPWIRARLIESTLAALARKQRPRRSQ